MIDIDLLRFEPFLDRSHSDTHEYIYDPIRKKKIVLGPEEFVRQLFIQYLLSDDQASKNRIAVEKQFKWNNMIKRFDILIYNQDVEPYTLIECKAPSHKLTQKDLDQIIAYNLKMNAPYLILTNGQKTYAWHIDLITTEVKQLSKINIKKLFN